jgi:predicted RNA polymerase sigma factor
MKDGWSVREICEALNISEAAAKSRLVRARKRLSAQRSDEERFTTHHRRHFERASSSFQPGQVSKT